MHTTVTARHCEISEELRERALAILQRLAAQVIRPVDGTVVFDVLPAGALAEIRLHGGRGELFVASGEDRDHRSALDRAEEKLRRQVAKAATAARRGRGARDAV